MIKRNYYSVRAGKLDSDGEIDFEMLKKLFLSNYNILDKTGYFQKYFGFDCSEGFQRGEIGEHFNDYVFINIRKENLFPIETKIQNYTENDFFDVLEFLYDHCSKGQEGYFHDDNSWGEGCKRFHDQSYDDLEGQKHFRETMNTILVDYKDGFEISENGEILIFSDNGLSHLFEADIPTTDADNISNKMNAAILKFRKAKSTLDDRKEAIRELADVLEYVRPEIKKYLDKKDENDIFNIANNFGIRHHKVDQKTNYNKAIWYSWIFYYYLATLHTVLRISKLKS
ncbi:MULTISPECIES: hypothetical protein [unclassified Flavobacterium]|uniref:hypothetical protein n=1 Tax=unclassified Flavobacterium TaxID=196869 RepID=UPI003F90B88E